MKTPPKYGVIVYAKNVNALAQFYMDMFDMKPVRETPDFISIANEGMNVVVHNPPIEIPENHFNAVKMFITVDSLVQARARAIELGGSTLDGEWSNPIFKLCNIADPEGNHIQLREFMA